MGIRIGVISDTHGLLRSEVKEHLAGCDYILHAGDVDNPNLLEDLPEPSQATYVVRGNNDWGGWAYDLSRVLVFTIGGVKFCMTHNRDNVPWDLNGVQVVVFGHSHQYCEEMVLGRLWLNPGSCGYPRFRRELTMAMVTVENGRVDVERIDLRP